MKRFLVSAFIVLVVFAVKSILFTGVVAATGGQCRNGKSVCRGFEVTWSNKQ